jgi:hypothetical protein
LVTEKKQASLFIGWLKRVDQADDVFLQEIRDFSAQVWDHYTHLRLAFVVLKQNGRQKAIPQIFDLIRSFIENSKRTNGKTFHVTMTYFWIHMIHFAIVQTGTQSDDWKTFLLMNPLLANGGLYLHYYTKDLMLMNPDSRVRNKAKAREKKKLIT